MPDRWRHAAVYMPDVPSSRVDSAMRSAMADFDSFTCELGSKGPPFRVHGSGGQPLKEATPLEQLTQSKMQTYWAVHALGALRCRKPPSSSRIESLQGWIFMPTPKGPCGNPSKWQPLNMLQHCRNMSAHTNHTIRVLDKPSHAGGLRAIPRPSALMLNGTSIETWWLGQLTRHVLASIGPCAREARDSYLRARSNLGIKEGGLSIAMQVRRGDSCKKWSNEARQGRACYPLDDYMTAALQLRQRYGVSHIRLATDSPSVVQQAAQFTGTFSFTFLRMNRTAVGGPEGVNLHRKPADAQRNNIEIRIAAATEHHKSLLFGTLLADTELLARHGWQELPRPQAEAMTRT